MQVDHYENLGLFKPNLRARRSSKSSLTLLLLIFAFSLPLVNQCVVPKNIHTSPPRRATEIPREEGVQKEAISEGVGGGGAYRDFFQGVWVRLASY